MVSNPAQARFPFSNFKFTNAAVVCLTAMISHVFISFSVVYIYGPSSLANLGSWRRGWDGVGRGGGCRLEYVSCPSGVSSLCDFLILLLKIRRSALPLDSSLFIFICIIPFR